jgi:hypothetical protein
MGCNPGFGRQEEFPLTKAETSEQLASRQAHQVENLRVATILVNGSYLSPRASDSSPPSAAARAFPQAA